MGLYSCANGELGFSVRRVHYGALNGREYRSAIVWVINSWVKSKVPNKPRSPIDKDTGGVGNGPLFVCKRGVGLLS